MAFLAWQNISKKEWRNVCSSFSDVNVEFLHYNTVDLSDPPYSQYYRGRRETEVRISFVTEKRIVASNYSQGGGILEVSFRKN